MPEIGQTLAGKYRLDSQLGEGGMGVVFRAEHLKLARRVAIKMLLPDALGDAEMVTRLQREARAAAQLESPHVARVLDVDETPEGVPYIVMELLEGHDLEHELTTRGRLPLPEALGWLLQACEAMVEAHGHGIVHRDLKPSNMFLARARGSARTLKILDFGISKLQSDNVKLTVAGRPMGTPLYMSPEQVRSAAAAGQASDQWALAVILYELLAGTPPFMGDSVAAVAAAVVTDPPPPLSRFVQGVPEVVQLAVNRALAKDPGARFPDVASFAAVLAPFGARTPVESSMPPSIDASPDSFARTMVANARTGPVVETSAGTTRNAGAAPAKPRTKEKVALAAAAIALLSVGVGLVTWVRRPPERGLTTVVATTSPPITSAPATPTASSAPAPVPSTPETTQPPSVAQAPAPRKAAGLRPTPSVQVAAPTAVPTPAPGPAPTPAPTKSPTPPPENPERL